MPSDGWDWELADRAKREIEKLENDDQERIVKKLDEIVGHEWRDPPYFLEPLQGASHSNSKSVSSDSAAVPIASAKFSTFFESGSAVVTHIGATTDLSVLTPGARPLEPGRTAIPPKPARL